MSAMKKGAVIAEWEALAPQGTSSARVKWDEEMVEALLALRLVEYKKRIGEKNTSTQQRSASWEKLTLAWNTRMTIAKNTARMTSKQLQEKYGVLKVWQPAKVFNYK